jgi:hypothetical protein
MDADRWVSLVFDVAIVFLQSISLLYLIRLDRRLARAEAMNGRLKALCDAYGIEEDGVTPVVLSRLEEEDD